MHVTKTTWDKDAHTDAKHFIIRKYLDAWIPILASTGSNLIYIDGFAGPGEYINEETGVKEIGSPIIALDALSHQVVRFKSQMLFIFIEKDEERCENLKRVLSEYSQPEHAFVEEPICGVFDEEVTNFLDRVEEDRKRLTEETGRRHTRVPTFALIDPFGHKMPMSIIKRLMASSKSEILVTLVIQSFIRWCSLPDREDTLNELFACSDWKEICKMDKSVDKGKLVRDLYIKQLKDYAEVKYALYFKMVNKHNQTSYYLIFGTNDWHGIKLMKEAMWKVDPTGNYEFSDLSDPTQTTFMHFTDMTYNSIQNELKKLSGKTMTIDEIEEYITLETPFPTNSLRSKVLNPLEKSGNLIAITSRPTSRISYRGKSFKVKFI
jgi:three-Cys-motif partner protein